MQYFKTHQLKCKFQQHPTCDSLKQFTPKTVKIHPLATFQTIKDHLVIHDPEKLFNGNPHDHGQEFELLVNDKVIPYEMSTYQAIFKFSEANYAGGYCFYFTSII